MGEAHSSLAARMGDAPEPGTVLVSENTFHWEKRSLSGAEENLAEITVRASAQPTVHLLVIADPSREPRRFDFALTT